jgi:hypothetical protein
MTAEPAALLRDHRPREARRTRLCLPGTRVVSLRAACGAACLSQLSSVPAWPAVLGITGVGGDERQVDLRLRGRGQLDLRAFRRLARVHGEQPPVAEAQRDRPDLQRADVDPQRVSLDAERRRELVEQSGAAPTRSFSVRTTSRALVVFTATPHLTKGQRIGSAFGGTTAGHGGVCNAALPGRVAVRW